MSDLQAGDVVRLKSGGPHMTVTSVGDNYGKLTAWTVWFEKSQEKSGSFPPVTLVRVADDANEEAESTFF